MKIKAYKSDRGYGFSMLLKSKTADGREIKCYLPIGFKKGEEPSDTAFIDATDYFLTCYETKTGETRPKLFIMSWLGISDKNDTVEAEYTETWKPVDPIDIDGDDLPF